MTRIASIAAAALIALAAGQAQASFKFNGTADNGFTLNGFTLNGFTLNGFTLNGFTLNGSQAAAPVLTLRGLTLPGGLMLDSVAR